MTDIESWHGTRNGYTHRGCRCEACQEAGRAMREHHASRPNTGDEPWHGTITGYANRRCRCERCREAPREAARRRRAEPITGTEPWHGTTYGYSGRGCRCERCTMARSMGRRASTYGLTIDQVTELLTDPSCAICGSDEHSGNGWAIDHDHACCPGDRSCGNCVRGVLCHRCNTFIGLAADDPAILAAAIAYLEGRR